ncbi:hypothetical protein V6N11_043143 [Hibiscus sabdariffa]|uniref:Uncharacterized protein n=1 Tax=Hibiscus sabdariffa TaxID=183260 RepID=A0ABR2QZ17_9ROSI
MAVGEARTKDLGLQSQPANHQAKTLNYGWGQGILDAFTCWWKICEGPICKVCGWNFVVEGGSCVEFHANMLVVLFGILSGVTTRQSARTNVGVKRNVNSSSSSVAPKKKRKTTSESVREPVGTQEPVAPKK